MGDRAVIVVDTNVLMDLATPVVDHRDDAPSGADPLKGVLSTYDVHVPSAVLGELADLGAEDDLLGTAAATILSAAQWLTEHDVDDPAVDPVSQALDEGETHCIDLANTIGAEMFVTDELNSFKFQLVSLAIDDRNVLFTTPQLVCILADHGVLEPGCFDHALTYYVETKQWDRSFVDVLRTLYLSSD